MGTDKRTAGLVLLVGLVSAAVLAFGGVAAAQTDPYTDDEVGGRRISNVRPVPPDPQNDEVLGRRIGNLPVTGADLTLFVATGVATIATGTVLLKIRRKPQSEEE